MAGDIFDTEWPEDRTIVQAVSRMQRADCRWWLLPGNHDYARNGGLWDRVLGKGAENVAVLSQPEAREIEDGVWILPAPLQYRHQQDDPTAAFDEMGTPGARLRIGLAHGSIQDFGSKGETNNYIAPDRAERSKLDYLALGDWHGALRVGDRTWYSGTPETDRFQRDEPGQVLLAELAPGELPKVEAIRTGRFQWLVRDWSVGSADSFAAQLDELLSALDQAATLLRLKLNGIVNLRDRVGILGRLEDEVRHLLRHLEVSHSDLVARPTDEDMKELKVEGMLGRAAELLSDRIEAGGNEAAMAKKALEKLFVEFQRTGETA